MSKSKIIYVLKDAGRCGGHRVVLEHLKGLASRGYDCQLCYISSNPDCWFENINFNLNKFSDAYNLINYLKKNKNAVKVATWWETAYWVAEGGGGYYLVQDIETSYSDDIDYRNKVLNTYSLGLHHIVKNAYPYAALKYIFNTKVSRISIAVDHDIFKPLGVDKIANTALYFYRNNHLKNPQIMIEAMSKVKNLDVLSYGQTPLSGAINYLNITDNQLAELMNKVEVFISTSLHEGFCLPLLEAMACGTPVITTRAIGNETFCIDNVNCLIIKTSDDLIEAINKIKNNNLIKDRLITNGLITASNYKWDKVIDELECLYNNL